MNFDKHTISVVPAKTADSVVTNPAATDPGIASPEDDADMWRS